MKRSSARTPGAIPKRQPEAASKTGTLPHFPGLHFLDLSFLMLFVPDAVRSRCCSFPGSFPRLAGQIPLGPAIMPVLSP
jgi:hypothetical protein